MRFRGTEHETDTCPRRLALREPWVGDALRLHRGCEGRMSPDASARYSGHVADALLTIESARAHRERMAREAAK